MKTTKYTYWKDGQYFLGYLNDYPDYQTQGRTKAGLVAHLTDLLADMESGEIPYIRKVEELVLADRKDVTSSGNWKTSVACWSLRFCAALASS